MALPVIPRRGGGRKPGPRNRRPQFEGLEPRRLLAVVIQEYPISGTSHAADGIALGPDGKLWFAETARSEIGVFDPNTRTSVNIPTMTPDSHPTSITSGPGGLLWFVEEGNGSAGPKVASVDPSTHSIAEYPVAAPTGAFGGIASDAIGHLWLTDSIDNKIGEFDATTHAFTEFATPTAGSDPIGITSGPGGTIRFTENAVDKIGELDPATASIREYPAGAHGPYAIAMGPDGNLWYTNIGSSRGGNNLGTIDATTHAATTFSTTNPAASPAGIAAGPYGFVAFTLGQTFGLIVPATHAITYAQAQPTEAGGPAITNGPGGNPWFLDEASDGIGYLQILPDTTTSLVANPNPATVGASVTLTATVSPALGNPMPTGSVTFLDGSTRLGAAPLNGQGMASLTVPSLTVGTHGITAEYGGDPGNAPSTSATVDEVIQPIHPTILLRSTLNPSRFGQPVTYSATVANAPGVPTPTGPISIQANGQTIGYGYLANGTFSVTDSSLPPGPNAITVFYYGDANYAPSTTATFTQGIERGASVTGLVVSPNPQTTGRPVTLTASVTSPDFPQGFVGSVTFFDGSTPLGTSPVSDGNPAVLVVPALTAGLHAITADYSGNFYFAPSASDAVTVSIVAVPATTTTVFPGANPTPIFKPLALTATVATTSGGVPTGTVTFLVTQPGAANVVLFAPLSADGKAVATVDPNAHPLQIGIYEVAAIYSGDATFSPSLSNLVYESYGPPDGPRVASAVAVGTRNVAAALVFTFDEPLYGPRAEDVSNYVIVGPNGRRVAIKSAVYNPATDSVVVTPRSRLAGYSTYILTVVGVGPTGITDTDGRFLDGEYVGFPGSNFSTPFKPASAILGQKLPAAPKPNLRGARHVHNASAAARWHR